MSKIIKPVYMGFAFLLLTFAILFVNTLNFLPQTPHKQFIYFALAFVFIPTFVYLAFD
jgi:hypothetical protein